MSNFRAIASVTRVLEGIVATAAAEAVPGSTTTVGRPRAGAASATSPAANIYLYRTQLNTSLRTTDLPTRRADGSLVQAPRIPLDLHYLLSFTDTDDAPLAGQLMLARSMTAILAQPYLPSDYVKSSIDALAATGRYPELVGSDLGDQAESIRMSVEPLGLEELSKLWSVFFQTPHSLSFSLCVSVIVLDAALVSSPSPAVKEPKIQVVPSLDQGAS